MDEYAQALERSGFTVLEALDGYPGAPGNAQTTGA